MILVIKNKLVVATHTDEQNITAAMYPGCEIATYAGTVEIGFGPVADPRTAAEKALIYQDKRKAEYPSLADQLDMIYWDKVNRTSKWEDCIRGIKEKYPKV